jgi:hypothetical protein
MALQHRVQRGLGRLVAPIWVPLAALMLRFHFGYRIENLAEVRREAERIRAQSSGPMLVCANHLTLIDSMLVAWALAPTWRYLIHFDLLPWNTPEEKNFANTLFNRIVIYLAKCVPIERGGTREGVARVLNRIGYLLQQRELALVFPEGGRSRTGRVTDDAAAWGVGRIVAAAPGCRVLCVYLRGDSQETWSDYPARGERIHVSLACIEPKSDHRGVRRTRDLAQQIVSQLIQMEERHFDGR